jgi:hypothetical protein
MVCEHMMYELFKNQSRDLNRCKKSKKMKKLIGSVALLLVLSFAAFAGGQEPGKKLFNDLKAALKTSSIINSSFYYDNRITLRTFEFNGRFVSACYFDENELIGFTIPVGKNELPETISGAVTKKYNDWKMEDAILLIDASANTSYFVQINKGGSSVALQVSLQGRTSVYGKM